MKKFLGLFLIVPLMALTACDVENGSAQRQQTQQVESNQKNLMQTIPAPSLQTSLERINIKRRLETLNKENQTSYIYLVSYGNVMAYYSVSGKVSSLNSYMVPTSTIVDDPYGNLSAGGEVVESPDLDGTYGENASGIFFFTTEGAYVEWKGEYLWSDQPLRLNQPVQLTREVK